MISVRRFETHQWLATANVLLAAIILLRALASLPHALAPAPTTDIDAVGYAWLAVIVCAPIALLFALAATAHWRHWPMRWIFQALAVALPVALGAFFLLFK